MSQPTEQRPPQVTLASSIVMFASLMVLLAAWEQVSTLGSLETQQAIRDFLGEAPFSSLGLDVTGATEALRIACMVAAAAACATGVLGWYVRKPDRSARLGLSVFAVPVFVTGLAAGGLAGSFVAAGAVMLWTAPAREWFATGRWTPPSPAPDRQVRDKKGPAQRRTTPDEHGSAWSAPRPPAPDAGPPPSTRPFGEPVRATHSPYGQPLAPDAAPAAGVGTRQQLLRTRPGAMVAAFVITVVTAGGLLGLSLLWIAIAGLSPDFLMSVLEQQQPDLLDDGITLDQVQSTVFALAGGFIVWCGLALVLAGFAMARRDWARRGLIVSAAFSAGACIALVVSTPLTLIPAAAAVATVVCLRRGDVRRWFALEPR
ncbi:hypothetical protein ASG76_00090 [Nocardioides sp. Soil774]|uniref:hypothetical protein n=1 Tax=Nocardioides sp. Soil774 TaxID=1736408 RepID=UPI0006F409EB|nr:hypothetical protein [Nocardioides sp. Soil774]KRE97176.1 hypothetical protein ASG76_00090 [Nocardioides sp. Soil774]